MALRMTNKAWLIRPKPSGIDRLQEFLDEQMIAVGWPGLGDLTGTREYELKLKLRQEYADNASALSALKMIVYRMSPGDFVLVPQENSIFFGEIVSNYIYEERHDEITTGFPHQRRVEWFDLVLSRDELPTDLQKSTRVVRTAAELTKHIHLIEELLSTHQAKRRRKSSEANPSDSMDEEQLVEKAKRIVGQELASEDPLVRLRAAEVIFNYFNGMKITK